MGFLDFLNGNKSKTITFTTLPKNIEELKAMPQAALTDEYEAAALVVALSFEQPMSAIAHRTARTMNMMLLFIAITLKKYVLSTKYAPMSGGAFVISVENYREPAQRASIDTRSLSAASTIPARSSAYFSSTLPSA